MYCFSCCLSPRSTMAIFAPLHVRAGESLAKLRRGDANHAPPALGVVASAQFGNAALGHDNIGSLTFDADLRHIGDNAALPLFRAGRERDNGAAGPCRVGT